MDSQSESTRALARPYRKAVLKALLFLTIGAGLIFVFLNLAAGRIPLAVAEIGMVLFAIFVLVAIHNSPNVERWALIYLVPFFLTMMFSMVSQTSNITVFAWVLLIPILSHLLLGRKFGLVISCIFFVSTAVIYVIKNQDKPELLEPLAIANVSLIAFCVLAFSHVYELTRERSELRLLQLAQTDALTGLANRIRLKETFERERNRAQRENTPTSLIVLDLDHFKAVNDQFGHEAGDIALKKIADILNQSLRATDLPARMGGEEFGIVLPNTDTLQAIDVSEKIRKSVEDLDLLFDGQAIHLTLSGGIAELNKDGSDLRSLLSSADKRLYQAKASGRNQIVAKSSAEESDAIVA